MGTRIAWGVTLLFGLGIAVSSAACSILASPAYLLGIPIGLLFVIVGGIGILPTANVPAALRDRWFLLFAVPIGVLCLMLSALTSNVAGMIVGVIAIGSGAVAVSSSPEVRKRLVTVATLLVAALLIVVGLRVGSLVMWLGGLNVALVSIAFADILPPRGVVITGRAATVFRWTIQAPLVVLPASSLGLLTVPIAALLLALTAIGQISLHVWAWRAYPGGAASQGGLPS